MALHLLNSKSGAKELFLPINPDCVTMYVCGPTVYNYVHIGNGLSAVVFDVLFRLLQASYPKVVYARNITDIDDRINAVYQETQEPIASISARYIKAYTEDVQALGCLAPTLEPCATDYIDEMTAIIKRLIAKQHAYEHSGHVLFHVPSDPNYGALNNRSLDDMLTGARIEPAPYKKHPGDFVLWKPSTDDLPGWNSPWGRGRPGWHLECTAMIHSCLGTSIDIHGGGHDLQFPHHENELAQSSCIEPNAAYANYWLHNGMLRIDKVKMSKSIGNFLTIRQLLAHWNGETLRYALLSGHYRAGVNWSEGLLQQAHSSLNRLYRALQAHADLADTADTAQGSYPEDMLALLENDLNTPEALAALHKKANQLLHGTDPTTAKRLVSEIKSGGWLLGLCQHDADEWFQSKRLQGAKALDVSTASAAQKDTAALREMAAHHQVNAWRTAKSKELIEALMVLRNQARADKDFDKADEMRAMLTKLNIEIEDTRDGGRWHYSG